MSIRIVATADNHLGAYSARMPVRTLDQRRARLRRAFGAVVDFALAREAHLCILAGDVFDSPNPRNLDRVYMARRLRELEQAGVRVVAIGGNHDTPRSMSEQGGYLPLAIYAELGALTFFDHLPTKDPVVRPEVVELAGLRVAVGGFTPNANISPADDPLDGITFDDQGADLRVLVVHGPVEGTVYPHLGTAVIRRLSLERLRDVDLVIIGDIHRFATFVVNGTRVVIPGATEWLNFGDAGAAQPGFAAIEVSSREEIVVRHEPVPPQPRAEIIVEAGDLEVSEPTAIVLSFLDAEADRDKLVRLTIRGTLSREAYGKLNLVTIEERGRKIFFFFELNLSQLLVRSLGAGREVGVVRRPIAEEIVAIVEARLGRTDDVTERAVLRATQQRLLATLQELDGRGS